MKIILASQSPRRKYLLEQMGLEFTQIPSNFEEYFDDSRPVNDVVKELGLGKARDVAISNHDAIVIGSDLIVVLDGKQIGKPESEEDAKRFLRNLSGRRHELICSVAVVCKSINYEKVLTDTAHVVFDELSEKLIAKYVATGTTYDKAGGYAIQHPLIRSHIKNIEGRLDTIIGLPTNLVAEMLKDFDIDVEPLELNFKDPKAAKILFE